VLRYSDHEMHREQRHVSAAIHSNVDGMASFEAKQERDEDGVGSVARSVGSNSQRETETEGGERDRQRGGGGTAIVRSLIRRVALNVPVSKCSRKA
jgi:hypothetical protein